MVPEFAENPVNDMSASRNPYHRPPGSPKLVRSIVVLMDILGYTDLTRRAEKEGRSQNLLVELYESLKTAREQLEDTNLIIDAPTSCDRFILRAFTDNIFIGWPIATSTRTAAGAALRHALEKVSLFQLDMALRGFFVRGAISVGDVFIDEIAVFGPALIDAYEAERSYVDTPRIILNPSAVETESDYRTHYSKSGECPISHRVCMDVDGRRFVNYLNSGRDDSKLIDRHQVVVTAKLEEFQTNTKVLRKYRWVAEYHNSFCAKYPKELGQRTISLS